MSDTLEHDEIADDVDKVAATDIAQDGGEQQSEPPEDKARRQGWRPLDQFKGPPEKWVDAATFLERGEKYAPFIQAENKKLEKALDAQRVRTAVLEKQLKDLGEFASKATINAYRNAKRDIEADIEAAAAAGDVEGVKTATKALVDLGSEAAAEAPIVKPEPDAEWQTAEEKWKADNPWFDKDKAMTLFALDEDRELAQTKPNMAAEDRLAEVAKRVRAEFPHKFTNPNRERPGAVEGAPSPGRRSSGRDFSNLPPEAKAFCDSMVKQGIMTREAYVKGYQWDSK